mmetsp:Transcript_20288/g.58658  ORF Transcript_20288/g.58658 Transcript_20288/m.58658 type:complete len:549 (-) Transcript_20288:32-1678(-)
MITEEITDLRALLAAKEKLAAEIKSDLDSHESTIEKVRTKFQRQTTRLAKKEEALADNRREWEAEKSYFENLKESHELAIEAHSEALVAHEDMMQCIQDEIVTAYKLEGIIIKEVVIEGRGDSEGNVDNNGGKRRATGDSLNDEELNDLQTDVVKYEAAVDESNQVLMAAKAAMSSLTEEIEKIGATLPALEEQKKSAAKQRDFKAAARASKEVKELASRKKHLEDELNGDISERHDAAKAEFEKAVDELDKKKTALIEREKLSGLASMMDLAKRIVRLKKVKQDVCGDTAGVESGYSVVSVGASVLESELDALKQRGDALGAKFGGWDRALLEAGGGDDSDKEEKEAEVAEGKADGNNEAEGEQAGEAEASDAAASEPPVSKANTFAEFRVLKCQLSEKEAALEDAIGEEDYELAAELDEAVAEINSKMEALGLTDDEKELALTDASGDGGSKAEGETVDDHAAAGSADQEKPAESENVEADVEKPPEVEAESNEEDGMNRRAENEDEEGGEPEDKGSTSLANGSDEECSAEDIKKEEQDGKEESGS